LDFSDPEIIVSETSTLPYACRIVNAGEVHIFHKLKGGLFIASLPSSEIDTVYQSFKQVYPDIKPYKNVLQTLLQNGNNVINPAVSLLNIGRIESFANLTMNAIGNRDFIWVMMIEVAVGIMIALYMRAGVIAGFTKWAMLKIKTRKSALGFAWLMGIFVFLVIILAPFLVVLLQGH